MEKKILLRINNSKTEGTKKYGTILDAVFTRHIENVQFYLYISYYSYQKPIITTIDRSISDRADDIIDL